MEDDDEIRSPPTPSPPSASPSPSPSPSPPRAINGRITVTVPPASGADATASPAQPQPQPPLQNSLALALPIQHPRGGVGGGGGGREDCWSEGATAVLIEAWGERYLELSRGNLKQKHWKEVADVVSGRDDYTKPPKSDIQCKNRIDTVKKKYKQEKAKIAASGGPSRWRFFDKLDQLIGPSAKYASPTATAVTPSTLLAHKDVPVGIPVGIRSSVSSQQRDQRSSQAQQQQKQGQQPRGGQKMQIRKGRKAESESDPEFSDNGGSSTDSLPPEIRHPKRAKPGRGVKNQNEAGARPPKQTGNNGLGSSIGDLTRAIANFGEVYEQTETAKLQQQVEMEKQRMKFAKELELQRMQFFMNTQLEISQIRRHPGKKTGIGSADGGKRGGGGGSGSGGSGGNQQHRKKKKKKNNSDDSN